LIKKENENEINGKIQGNLLEKISRKFKECVAFFTHINKAFEIVNPDTEERKQ